MFTEENLLPISGLQHFAFCPRQCALIHIEQEWRENFLSAQGRQFHETAHNGMDTWERDKIVLRSLRLVSYTYGLSGYADVVELHRSEQGLSLPHVEGRWIPKPIEYKRGKNKPSNEDRIQLCAQALCLEETWNVEITEGYIFYGQTRRRESVSIDVSLRSETKSIIKKFRDMLSNGYIPPAIKQKGCRSCSLAEVCMPRSRKSASKYIFAMLKEEEEY